MNRLLEYSKYLVVTLLAKEQYGLNKVDQNNNFTVMIYCVAYSEMK